MSTLAVIAIAISGVLIAPFILGAIVVGIALIVTNLDW